MSGLEKEAFRFRGRKPKASSFYPNPTAARLKNSDKIEKLTGSEIDDFATTDVKTSPDGGLIDAARMGLRFIAPKTERKLTKPLDALKVKINTTDQKMAQKLIDLLKVKPGGFLHRSLTVNKPLPLAKVNDHPSAFVSGTGPRNEERMLYDIDARTPSLFAPIQNPIKFGSPILAGMYAGEKLYGSKDDSEEKTAASHTSIHEKQGILGETELLVLDKKAALEKVAALTEQLEITDGMLKASREEVGLYRKKIETTLFEKQALEKNYEDMEKKASETSRAHTELFYRMKARERAPHVVKMAETMLEQGIIKQAEFNNKVDFLMNCDDETFKLHEFISKTSNNMENILETSSYIVETRDRKEFPVSLRGISKRGQTIGEAALDLIK